MTKVLQCDAQARGRRVGHRARLERRDRMGHIRPEATVESVVGVRAHPDDGQPDGEQSFTSASAAGLSLGGHPGSMFVA